MDWTLKSRPRTVTFEHHSGDYVIKTSTHASPRLRWELTHQGRSLGHFRFLHMAKRAAHKHDVLQAEEE
jgi:hypothetical protein